MQCVSVWALLLDLNKLDWNEIISNMRGPLKNFHVILLAVNIVKRLVKEH